MLGVERESRNSPRGLSMIAGLSSAHLAAILFPSSLRRLYILRVAGGQAAQMLTARCLAEGIEADVLTP